MKPITATITRQWPDAMDVRTTPKGGTDRFTKNDDGTWSAWTKAGYLRRKPIRGHLFFHLIDGQLYPTEAQR